MWGVSKKYMLIHIYLINSQTAQKPHCIESKSMYLFPQ